MAYKNIKPEVVAALESDATIAGIVSNRIFFQYPPKDAQFPCITYYELDNRPALNGDEEELASELVMMVDVWSRASTSELAGEVDRVMKSLGFKREFSGDLVEPGKPPLYHRAMRFLIKR